MIKTFSRRPYLLFNSIVYWWIGMDFHISSFKKCSIQIKSTPDIRKQPHISVRISYRIRILKLNEILKPLEGAMYISLWEILGGITIMLVSMQFSTKIAWKSNRKYSSGLPADCFDSWQLCNEQYYPLEQIFHFHHLPKLYFGFSVRGDSEHFGRLYLHILFLKNAEAFQIELLIRASNSSNQIKIINDDCINQKRL